MIDAVRARVQELLSSLDAVVALQHTRTGTAPALFKEDDDFGSRNCLHLPGL